MAHPNRNNLLLSALLALAGTTACAAWAAPNEAKSAPEERKLVLAAVTPSHEMVPEAENRPTAYPPLEAGVRHAADQGPEALRRYVLRTRMIYNYRFEDFARDSW
jgi:hypothetical protein